MADLLWLMTCIREEEGVSPEQRDKQSVFKIFSLSGNHTILVFSVPNIMALFRRGPNGGAKCRWGRQKSRFSTNILLHRVLSTVQPQSVIHAAAPNRTLRGKLVTLIAGKRRCLLFTADDDEVFMTRSLNVSEDNKTAFNCTQWKI